MNVVNCLWVFMGGGLGAVSRYLLGIQAVRWWGMGFPYGTLLINVLGSFVIGILAGYFTYYYAAQSQALRLLLIVGFLGGFTTFSSFSLETLALYQKGESLLALGYVFGSVLVSLSVVTLGYELMRLKAQ